jgi:hypothetical protein
MLSDYDIDKFSRPCVWSLRSEYHGGCLKTRELDSLKIWLPFPAGRFSLTSGRNVAKGLPGVKVFDQ